MGHADPMRFHGMILSIIIISTITIIVIADFLLAASLTVGHGLPGHCCLRLLLLLLLLCLRGSGRERRGLGEGGGWQSSAEGQAGGRRGRGCREGWVLPGRRAESEDQGEAAVPTPGLLSFNPNNEVIKTILWLSSMADSC